MKRRISVFCAALLLAGLLCFGGCATRTQNPALYDSRVEFVGDASGVGNLIDLLQYGTYGKYTFALQTDSAPYGLTISYEAPPEDPAQFDADMEKKSCLLFALIGNLGEVHWEYPGEPPVFRSFSYETACERIGSDIRSYSTSAEKLQDLIDLLQTEA